MESPRCMQDRRGASDVGPGVSESGPEKAETDPVKELSNKPTTQQSNPVSPTVLPTVTVTATSPLQQVTTTAQYEYPLTEAPLGDGLLDFVRQILAELSHPPHEVLSPQEAGINFQTGHYINRVGPGECGSC